MNISELRREEVVVLRVSGRLDASTADMLAARLGVAIDAGERRFIVDATRLEYVASAGLQVLLATAKRLRPLAGRIVLSALGEPIRRVFEIAGLSKLFETFPDESAAVAALRR